MNFLSGPAPRTPSIQFAAQFFEPRLIGRVGGQVTSLERVGGEVVKLFGRPGQRVGLTQDVLTHLTPIANDPRPDQGLLPREVANQLEALAANGAEMVALMVLREDVAPQGRWAPA